MEGSGPSTDFLETSLIPKHQPNNYIFSPTNQSKNPILLLLPALKLQTLDGSLAPYRRLFENLTYEIHHFAAFMVRTS